MRSFFKKLFCEHDYKMISLHNDYSKEVFIGGYDSAKVCTKCGDKIYMDKTGIHQSDSMQRSRRELYDKWEKKQK